MSITHEDYQTFEQYWGQSHENFEIFKHRICVVIERNRNIWDNISQEFAYYYGCKIEHVRTSRDIIRFIRTEVVDSVQEIAKLLQCIIFATYKICDDINSKLDNFYSYKKIVAEIYECIRISKQPLDIKENNRKHIVVPLGEVNIEKGVVLPALHWLQRFPDIQKQFANTLEMYRDIYNTPDKERNIIDNLRFCMESLLKILLNNEKPIEKQSEELGKWLEEKEVDKETINLYSHMIRFEYKEYANVNSKHGVKGKYFIQELEFRLYLTSTFIRFLSTLD